MNWACAHKAWSEPGWVIRTLAISAATWIVIAIGLAWVDHGYIEATKPMDPILLPFPDGKMFNLERRPLGGYWLRLNYKVDPSPTCIRESVHTMYRQPPGAALPETYTLSSAVNGRGISVTPPTFTALYLLPIDFPRGDWNYVYRASFRCWPLDLVHHEQKTPVLVIHIPELDEELKPE